MDDNLYDEFGNYIGPDIDLDSSVVDEEEVEAQEKEEQELQQIQVLNPNIAK
jgi:hypothetical protein